MGDHTESLQVDFDPSQIQYSEITDLFWKMHNPCAKQYSRQYMSAIWYHDADQKAVLENVLGRLQESFDGGVSTPVEAFGQFYLAEDYHQKYRLQSKRKLMSRFRSMYPDFADFNNSTAAARLNGFVSGHGAKSLFESESGTYGFERTELDSEIRI